MSEKDLEKLIADWWPRLGAESGKALPGPTQECPPLTRLWRHLAQGEPLAEYEDHVGQCDRCRRLSEIIEQSVAPVSSRCPGDAAGAPSVSGAGDGFVPSRHRGLRRSVYAAAGLLAAACITLVFVSWPQPSFEPVIAEFMDQADEMGDSALRGQAEEPPTGDASQTGRSGQQTRRLRGAADAQAWITAALNDPSVQEALVTHAKTEGIVRLARSEGRLRIAPDGRIALAEGLDEATVERLGLHGLIEEDRAACETIVEALMRHVPGARPRDRARIAQALNHWRAENVFRRHGLPE